MSAVRPFAEFDTNKAACKAPQEHRTGGRKIATKTTTDAKFRPPVVPDKQCSSHCDVEAAPDVLRSNHREPMRNHLWFRETGNRQAMFFTLRRRVPATMVIIGSIHFEVRYRSCARSERLRTGPRTSSDAQSRFWWLSAESDFNLLALNGGALPNKCACD